MHPCQNQSLLVDLYYTGAINPLQIALTGPMAEAVLALKPSGKSLSTDQWILLASWHVTLKTFQASTMRTCLLTACALALRLRLRLRLRLEGGRVGSARNHKLRLRLRLKAQG